MRSDNPENSINEESNHKTQPYFYELLFDLESISQETWGGLFSYEVPATKKILPRKEVSNAISTSLGTTNTCIAKPGLACRMAVIVCACYGHYLLRPRTRWTLIIYQNADYLISQRIFPSPSGQPFNYSSQAMHFLWAALLAKPHIATWYRVPTT